VSTTDVSVVVAWRPHTAARDVRLFLDGVAAQSCSPREVVVVHPEGSPVGDVVPDRSDVRVVFVATSRVDRMRRCGLSVATGEAVVFAEPGDRFDRDAVTKGVAALDAHPGSAFVYGRCTQPSSAGPSAQLPDLDRRGGPYTGLLRGNFVGPACLVMFRRSALRQEDLHDLAQADLDDYALYLRLARTGHVHGHDQGVALPAPPGAAGDPLQATKAELAALRAERVHLREPHHLAAYETGMTRLALRVAISVVAAVRGRTRVGRSLVVGAQCSALVLAGCPRALSELVTAEVVPWVARRRPRRTLLRLAATAHERSGFGPGEALAITETLRSASPPRSTVLVLAPDDPGLDVGDRVCRHVPPDAWASVVSRAEGDVLVVPRTSIWDLERRVPDVWTTLRDAWKEIWSGDDCLLYVPRASALPAGRKVLLAGYFSFPDAHATAGDLLVRDEIAGWLAAAGVPCDIANAPPFTGGVDWKKVAPGSYSHVVFACGPFHPSLRSWEVLERFPNATHVGVNLSMLAEVDTWNPFDVLIERDSDRVARPDIAFSTTRRKVPVVGVCLREHAGGTRVTDAAVRRLVQSTAMSVVHIDTRLDSTTDGRNSTGQRSAIEVESLIARMDVVVTTRLHGLVLALKNHVPVVAIDPGSEGNKIMRQAESVGWPFSYTVDTATDEALRDAFAHCLTDAGRALAVTCAARGREAGEDIRRRLLAAVAPGSADRR
jgi:hypothetical protein